MIQLQDIKEAHTQISPYIRQTPILKPVHYLDKPPFGETLTLKLENLQVTGAFKVRGALNKILQIPKETLSKGLIAVSGGNHGLAVAYGAYHMKVPATVFLPTPTPLYRVEKIKNWGAKVIFEGNTVDDSMEHAQEMAKEQGASFIHPFGDPQVIAGQGTLGLEIMEQIPDLDAIIVAIGGGGLISGIVSAVKALNPKIKVIGVEPYGAPTLYESLKAGHPITLSEISTKAGTLAAPHTQDLNFKIIQSLVDDVVLVSDGDMYEASQWLFKEMAVPTELSGAASIAALRCGKIKLPEKSNVCALICGAGRDFSGQ